MKKVEQNKSCFVLLFCLFGKIYITKMLQFLQILYTIA
ncbi:hypothetical protein RV09_GL002504 [Enterococcus moraviensis]|nr:hypothetical protein RU98_GL000411 [Enterococcus caccae]OJG67735.1 hypothetical protein RV09_GL002504 [Enterococcus moraviensis]